MDRPRILIVGAGATGLAAAWALDAAGVADWTLVDCERPLSDGRASAVDRAGFLYDPAARPFYRDDATFAAILDAVLGCEHVEHTLARRDARDLERCEGCGAVPGSRYWFPRSGGTGAFLRGVRARLSANRVERHARLVGVDLAHRALVFSDGEVLQFDVLVSTLPLPRLVALLPQMTEVACIAARLRCDAAHVVSVGIEGAPPQDLRDRAFAALSNDRGGFDALTFLSHLSPANVPSPGRQWSVLVESRETLRATSSVVGRGETRSMVQQTVDRLVEADVIPAESAIVNLRHDRIALGAPLDDPGGAVAEILTRLDAHGIVSRGRLGSWNAALIDPDLLFLEGFEAAEEACALAGTDLASARAAPPPWGESRDVAWRGFEW